MLTRLANSPSQTYVPRRRPANRRCRHESQQIASRHGRRRDHRRDHRHDRLRDRRPSEEGLVGKVGGTTKVVVDVHDTVPREKRRIGIATERCQYPNKLLLASIPRTLTSGL